MKPFHRTPPTTTDHPPRHVSWAAETVEIAALFMAVGIAHIFVSLVGHHADGPTMLVISGAALVVGAALHRWWGVRHRRPSASYVDEADAGRALWRVRTTLADRPGSLATLTTKLANLRVNILSIQIHPTQTDTAEDELLVATPPDITPVEVAAAITAGGGKDTRITPADPHDLVDPPTRVLTLAAHAATDRARLPHVLAALLSATTSDEPAGPAGPDLLVLHDPAGAPIHLSRPELPFTDAERARAHALIDLCARVHDADDADQGSAR